MLKYLCPSEADAPSQNLDMKYQWHPRSIQNIIHLYFTYESKIEDHFFFFLSESTFLSVNESFRIHPWFLSRVTGLF